MTHPTAALFNLFYGMLPPKILHKSGEGLLAFSFRNVRQVNYKPQPLWPEKRLMAGYVATFVFGPLLSK